MIDLKFDIQKRKNTYDLTIVSNILKTRINCLIDTGATVPVWCNGENTLLSYYPNAVKQNCFYILHGFGKGCEIATIYTIPDFVLSDGKNEIHYMNLPIAVVNRDFSFDMVLSYTMFNKMNISINTFTNRNGLHTVIPNIRISALKDKYYTKSIAHIVKSGEEQALLLKNLGTCNLIEEIYIFSQN